jgi:DNA polymerase III sliding clamp (beta) subunit (PCNA family)
MHIITTLEINEYLPGLLAIVPKRPTHAILANIYLETVKDGFKEGITLKATNLLAFLEIFLPCDVKVEGSVCIPAKLFSDIISTQAKNKKVLGTLEITSEYDNVADCPNIGIITSQGKQILKGMRGEDFVATPPLAKHQEITVNGVQFLKNCDVLSKYVSKGATTYQQLQYINFNQKKLIASDGSKLAYTEIETDNTLQFAIPPEMLAVLKKLNLAKKLADLENESISISVEEDDDYGRYYLLIEFDKWKFTQGVNKYDPLSDSLKIGEDPVTVLVDRKELISKLKAAIICSENPKKPTKLWLHSQAQAGRLYLVGDNSEDSLECNISETLTVAIEAAQLLAIAASLKTKMIQLNLPKYGSLLSIEVEGVNVCLAIKEKDNGSCEYLNEFLNNTDFTKPIVELPVINPVKPLLINQVKSEDTEENKLIEEKVKDAITHLQNLLATVTDVQMREAIVKEVMVVI